MIQAFRADPQNRGRRRWGGVFVAMVAAGAAPVPMAGCSEPSEGDKPPVTEQSGAFEPGKLVNTFIGTKDDGNTFPGASMPFGMIQVSPIGAHYAGWRYDDLTIRGFGHFFLSGAGCSRQGGQVSVLPTRGTIGAGAQYEFDTTVPEDFDHRYYAAAYTNEGEVGHAGYYKTRLTAYGGIDVEATAGIRTGVERYTFSAGDAGHIFVNVGQVNEEHQVTHSSAKILDDRTLEGSVETHSFCGGRPYTTWFVMKFDRPFSSFGTWGPEGGTPDSSTTEGGIGLRGAWLTFNTSGGQTSVTATTAISHVDLDGAHKNLKEEGTSADGLPVSFDKMRKRAYDAWHAELSRVKVAGGTNDDAAVFYTALYHALLQPLTGSDVDGRYRGFDDKIHETDEFTYYEFFSLWDTYRTQNQLLAMLWPSRAKDIARSVLTIHEQSGWLPRWAYANYETNVMTGDPVTPFLVDLWRFGALVGHEEQAYQALWQNVSEIPPADSPHAGRAGNDTYLSQGFVQYDKDFPKKGQDADPRHAGSATLEYSLADCSLSIMAAALGKQADAAALAQRGRSWQNVWDATVTDQGFTGFPRPKRKDGSWYTPDIGPYKPTSSDGFHEGTAWQYQWLIQQDLPGLIASLGGAAAAGQRLDAFFAYEKLLADPTLAVRTEWVVGPYNYYNQFRYNPNNEPDLHSPWMYALIGQPWKTSTVVRAAQTLFTNAPNGVTGNDDLGTMSAWYVFSALGFYPLMPGTGELILHAPRFPRVEIELENGRKLSVIADGADGSAVQYVDGVKVGDQPIDKVSLNWKALADGGELRFVLSATPPTMGWGTSLAAAPGSPCAAPK